MKINVSISFAVGELGWPEIADRSFDVTAVPRKGEVLVMDGREFTVEQIFHHVGEDEIWISCEEGCDPISDSDWSEVASQYESEGWAFTAGPHSIMRKLANS